MATKREDEGSTRKAGRRSARTPARRSAEPVRLHTFDPGRGVVVIAETDASNAEREIVRELDALLDRLDVGIAAERAAMGDLLQRLKRHAA